MTPIPSSPFFYYHLFWLIGKLIIALLSLDTDQVEELCIWIKIHVSYEANEVKIGKIDNDGILTAGLGLVGVLSPIIGLIIMIIR